MRSLQFKLLAGFLSILIAALVCFGALTAYLVSRHNGPEEFVASVLASQAELAAQVLLDRGKDALSQTLRKMDRAYPATHVLVDLDGRNVVDGSDLSELIAHAAPLPPFFGESTAISRPVADGRFRLLLVAKRPPPPWPLILAIPTAMILGCLALGHYLLRPLRRLQDAVRDFGQGRLETRSGLRQDDEIGRLAAEFDRMAERVEVLVNAERRLLQDVSHELRSPLARLAFALEMASMEDRDGGLLRAKKEYRRLTELVEELVELSRAEAETTPKTLVSVTELLAELVDDAQAEAEGNRCSIQFHAIGTTEVSGSALLLRRAVDNVLRNAIRYSPAGAAIELRVGRIGDAAEIRVRDRGPGVPADSLESIFLPFYRVEPDRARRAGGVGLGLSIARRAVSVHSGSIFACNAQPGLEVVIRLPVNGSGS